MTKISKDELYTIVKRMQRRFEVTKYQSFDLCDIKALPWVIKYYDIFTKKPYGKYALFPLELLIAGIPGIIRRVFQIKKHAFAQSTALIIRGNIELSKESKILGVNSIDKLYDWIIQQKSSHSAFNSWGQPYNWYSNDLIPKDTPRTTVSSQILHTVIDIYKFTHNDKYIPQIQSIANFFLKEMSRSVDTSEEVCFSYTLIDNYKVHNANMMAASALLRAGKVLSDKAISNLAEKCLTYTMQHQNPDGSWFYYELSDGSPSKIDHYHTGYVLEALAVIKENQKGEFLYNKEFEQGVNFYLDNLFWNKTIPKMTPKSIYPIDIQSCAQSIITLDKLASHNSDIMNYLHNVVEYTIKNFYNSKGWFYYRINKNERVKKISYIRWGDAWMYLAISRYLKYLNNE